MEIGTTEGFTEIIDRPTEAICDRSALPDGTALENGRYEIRTTLGNGGFGITYKAWDYRLQRYVAIKEFFPDGFAYRDAGQSREVRCIQDAQTFQHGKHRFQKEAQLLAKLDFSHIVRVHDSFEENNTVYIVMEYINGETLNRYVRRTGPIAASYLRELFLPLLRDLDAIHRAGMIHRDISPDNIMVTTDYGQLKLIDFGTAKDLTRSNERTIGYSVSQSVVRMNYSPLEMFSSIEKRPSADIYSICATMYFCLTGTEPPSSMDRAFDDTLPSGLNGHDRNLERVILKGMSLKPEGRYASAEELMQALSGQRQERKPQQERKSQQEWDFQQMWDLLQEQNSQQAQKNQQEQKNRQAQNPQQAQNPKKDVLKWLPTVLGCIAALVILILIPVMLLVNGSQRPAAANTAAGDAPEAAAASKAGTYEGNEYRNDYFGFRILLNYKWEDRGLQELNESYFGEHRAVANQTLDEFIDHMELNDALFTLNSVSNEDQARVQTAVVRVGLKGDAITTTDSAVNAFVQGMAKTAPDAEISRKNVTIGTQTLSAVYAEYTVHNTDGTEVPVYLETLFIRNRDYVAIIYLISYYEDDLDSLRQRVSFL